MVPTQLYLIHIKRLSETRLLRKSHERRVWVDQGMDGLGECIKEWREGRVVWSDGKEKIEYGGEDSELSRHNDNWKLQRICMVDPPFKSVSFSLRVVSGLCQSYVFEGR